MDRDVACESCGRFDNRGVSVDAVILREAQVLLVRRSAAPDAGRWAVPGGYVEWDESAEDAVHREVREETGLEVAATRLVTVRSDPARHPRQVIDIVFAIETTPGTPSPGDDAAEVRWFPLAALPADVALDHRASIEETLAVLR